MYVQILLNDYPERIVKWLPKVGFNFMYHPVLCTGSALHCKFERQFILVSIYLPNDANRCKSITFELSVVFTCRFT